MKKTLVSRRNFFKFSVLSAGALALPAIGLASVAAAPSQEALAAAQQPQGPAIPQPTFNPIASQLSFGAPTDISMGWDGTLWSIDPQGAPHIYDAINDLWQPHGVGIDAAVQMGDPLYFFKGAEFVTVSQQALLQTSAPKTIAEQWPTLPDSFKLGVMGAANWDGKGLVLFNGGRFVSTDGSIPLTALTALANWPQTPKWKDGVIDAVYATALATPIVLLRGGEYIAIDPVAKTVTTPPTPLSATYLFAHYLPADWVANGFDAMTVAGDYQIVCKGTAVTIYNSGFSDINPTNYLATAFKNWPAAWNPILQHAPSGRDGNLWSVMPSAQGSYILQHNGQQWIQSPDQADHVSVGQDNTVMLASAERLWRLEANGFVPLTPPNSIIQVSVGNTNAVWARDTNNTVYSFDAGSNALTPSADIGTATHIAATNDGSVWHCKPNDAYMHRYLSNTNVPQPAIPVKQDIVNVVQKVAATGFGAAHCLVQQSGQTLAYRYDSPYVFKTATDYAVTEGGTIAQGLGNLYFTDSGEGSAIFTVVAIDAHTGVERSRSAPLTAPLTGAHMGYGTPIFDSANELVYVGTRNIDPTTNSGVGQLLALDARDLKQVVWSYTAQSSIYGIPSLNGNTLLFGDSSAYVYAFDTRAAKSSPTPAPTGSWYVGEGVSGTIGFGPMLSLNNLIYAPMWVTSDPGDPVTPMYLSWVTIDPSSPSLTGTTQAIYQAPNVIDTVISFHTLLTRPVDANFASPPSSQTTAQYFFVNGSDSVLLLDGTGKVINTYKLTSGTLITTDLAWDADAKQLWFGTNTAKLYGLDTELNLLGNTPKIISEQPDTTINTTPVVFADPQGGKTILVGLRDIGNLGNLYGFDPISGNLASIGTGTTQPSSLSAQVSNGVIYAAGQFDGIGDGISQVFAIRVDVITQGQRDFIIESQLMQDPDQNATGSGSTDPNNLIPPSVARYQTHLTVVDDQKHPMPREAVKIWADVANTVISVNGQPFTIGPDDAQFAAVTTGVDGCLVITSDAADVNSSALRVWAAFMDPYERIVVFPDHEWHGRASSSNADPNQTSPDPSRPNLSTAYNYKGAPLFTQDEKNNSTPQSIATGIGQMNMGVNTSGTTPAALAGALKTLHASASGSQYVAYTDLAGMHYAPSNARTTRPAAVIKPIGLQFTKDLATKTHTYTPLSHTDARTAIDALDGKPWDPSNPNGTGTLTLSIRRSDNLFTDFWNWLVNAIKQVVADISAVVVSMAEDIVVGIQYFINGIAYAFKAIVKVIEDVVNAIGSFFLQLAKLIEDLIEALSVLLHFKEIMWTHRWLADQFQTQVTGLATAIKTYVKPAVDTFIQQGETAVKGFFDTLRKELGPNDQISNLKGSGSTPHTAFTAGPRGGATASHATECSWGIQRMKTGAPSGTASTSSTAIAKLRPADSMADPVSDFVAAFFARLSGDGDLSGVFDQLKSDFGNLLNSGSIQQFFSSLLTTLLDVLEALVVGALAVAGAFIDGILAIIDDLIAAILNIATEEIQIPVITWLYELLFQEKLNFINLFTLVAAIPVTILIRVVEGQYPSAILPATRVQGNKPARVAVASTTAQMALAICNGVFMIAYGLVNAIGDIDTEAPPFIGRLSAVLGLLTVTFATPTIGTADPSPGVWLQYGWNVAVAAIFIIALPDFKLADQNALPWASSVIGLIGTIVAIVEYVQGGSNDILSNLGFAENISGAIPTMLNAVKLAGTQASIVVGAFDVLGNMIAGSINIGLAFAITAREPLFYKQYMAYFPNQ